MLLSPKVFHICLPIEDEAGAVLETAQWSFICGNGTVFDQANLVCNFEIVSESQTLQLTGSTFSVNFSSSRMPSPVTRLSLFTTLLSLASFLRGDRCSQTFKMLWLPTLLGSVIPIIYF